MDTAKRGTVLRKGILLEYFTVGWNIVEGLVAVTAGVFAGSVALTGFGIDSFVETASGVIVYWRLREEWRGQNDERTKSLERKTSKITGTLLLLLAAYILIESTRRLLGFGGHAEESVAGLVVTAASAVVMPVLGGIKLRVAKLLNSGALRADAYETIACAWLSVTTLAGLLLNSLLGWWWADPVAGLLLVPLIVREGLEGVRGGCCACHDEA